METGTVVMTPSGTAVVSVVNPFGLVWVYTVNGDESFTIDQIEVIR